MADKQDKKRLRQNQSVSDASEDSFSTTEGGTKIEEEITIVDVYKQLQNVASKEDISGLRGEVERTFASLSKKIEVLEGKVYTIEKEKDELTNSLAAAEREREKLEVLLKEEREAVRELEQYGRRDNIKIYGLREGGRGDSETAEETIEAVKELFKEKLGVTVEKQDIANAHRLGKKEGGRERSVIVRFVRRTVKEQVITKRRALKGTKVVIADDLSPYYNGLFHEVREAMGPRNVWTAGGQVFTRLRGRVRRVDVRNREEVLAEARSGAENTESMDHATVARGLSTSPGQNMRGFGRGGRGRGGGDSSPRQAR